MKYTDCNLTFNKRARKRKLRISTMRIALTGVFTALIIAGAFFKIPTPLMPVSLQCAFCLLAGLVLGGPNGALCVSIYVLMGIAGLPIFVGGGGVFYVFQPSFGFLIGEILGAFIAGTLARLFVKRGFGYWKILLASFIGLASVYVIGLPYMYLIQNLYLGKAVGFGFVFVYGCALFLPTDILWCLLGSLIAYKLLPRLEPDKFRKAVYVREVLLDTENDYSESDKGGAFGMTNFTESDKMSLESEINETAENSKEVI